MAEQAGGNGESDAVTLQLSVLDNGVVVDVSVVVVNLCVVVVDVVGLSAVQLGLSAVASA